MNKAVTTSTPHQANIAPRQMREPSGQMKPDQSRGSHQTQGSSTSMEPI